MALLIKDDCINCDMCDPECPNEAITLAEKIYEINTDRCTQCIGHYEKPQCVLACPIDSIKPDPSHLESEELLLEKFMQLYR